MLVFTNLSKVLLFRKNGKWEFIVDDFQFIGKTTNIHIYEPRGYVKINKYAFLFLDEKDIHLCDNTYDNYKWVVYNHKDVPDYENVQEEFIKYKSW